MAHVRSAREIEAELLRAQQWASIEETDVPGMSYEQGVEAALRWAIGDTDEPPIENDYGEAEDES